MIQKRTHKPHPRVIGENVALEAWNDCKVALEENPKNSEALRVQARGNLNKPSPDQSWQNQILRRTSGQRKLG